MISPHVSRLKITTETYHFPDCSYEGQLINNGDSVSPVSSPCTTCRCEAGTVTCKQLTCPTLSCSHPAPHAPGDCCSTCNSCLYNGSAFSLLLFSAISLNNIRSGRPYIDISLTITRYYFVNIVSLK